MTYIKINDTLIPAEIFGIEHDRDWDYRHTKSVKCNLTYEEAKSLFVDGVEWSQIYQGPDTKNEKGEVIKPDPIITDNSEFEQVLSITENRDGTVKVTMGVTPAEEINAILMGGI